MALVHIELETLVSETDALDRLQLIYDTCIKILLYYEMVGTFKNL